MSNERYISKLLNLGDIKRDVVDPAFPEELQAEDRKNGFISTKYFELVSSKMQDNLDNARSLGNLLDPAKVRADLLAKLGRSFSVLIDETETEDFQRTLIERSTGLFAIKGTRTSYEVRGRASGFGIDVLNYYQIHPQYASLFNDDDLQEIPTGSFLDGKYFTTLPPGTVAGTPTEESEEYRLTAYVKLKFVLLQVPFATSTGNFLDKVIQKIRTVVSAHVVDVFFDLDIFIRAGLGMDARLKIEEELRAKGFLWKYFDLTGNDDDTELGQDPFVLISVE